MKELKVFRVQPTSFQKWKEFYEKITTPSVERGAESKLLREQFKQACDSPPSTYVKRSLKADLRAFSVYLDEAEHDKLVEVAKAKGVSKNIFIETVFNNLPVPV